MRRSASEIIRNLETRIARLEKQSSVKGQAYKYAKALAGKYNKNIPALQRSNKYFFKFKSDGEYHLYLPEDELPNQMLIRGFSALDMVKAMRLQTRIPSFYDNKNPIIDAGIYYNSQGPFISETRGNFDITLRAFKKEGDGLYASIKVSPTTEDVIVRIARLEGKKDSRKANLRYAGKGLKSVQSILPGISDRQANHFLHALATEIVDGDVKYSRSRKIEGDIEVYRHSMFHPSSPSYPEPETFESTSGVASKMVIAVDLRKLEVASKMSLTNLSIQKGSKALKDLCDSLTKNIENNILISMDEDELNIAFNYPMDQVSDDLYKGYSYDVKYSEAIEYEYVITDIKIKNDTLRVHVSTSIDYDVLVSPPRYTEDGWL